jgi:hypothetical protein
VVSPEKKQANKQTNKHIKPVSQPKKMLGLSISILMKLGVFFFFLFFFCISFFVFCQWYHRRARPPALPRVPEAPRRFERYGAPLGVLDVRGVFQGCTAPGTDRVEGPIVSSECI